MPVDIIRMIRKRKQPPFPSNAPTITPVGGLDGERPQAAVMTQSVTDCASVNVSHSRHQPWIPGLTSEAAVTIPVVAERAYSDGL